MLRNSNDATERRPRVVAQFNIDQLQKRFTSAKERLRAVSAQPTVVVGLRGESGNVDPQIFGQFDANSELPTPRRHSKGQTVQTADINRVMNETWSDPVLFCFSAADRTVTVDEMIPVLARMLEVEPTDPALSNAKQLFEREDKSGNRALEPEEFGSFWSRMTDNPDAGDAFNVAADAWKHFERVSTVTHDVNPADLLVMRSRSLSVQAAPRLLLDKCFDAWHAERSWDVLVDTQPSKTTVAVCCFCPGQPGTTWQRARCAGLCPARLRTQSLRIPRVMVSATHGACVVGAGWWRCDRCSNRPLFNSLPFVGSPKELKRYTAANKKLATFTMKPGRALVVPSSRWHAGCMLKPDFRLVKGIMHDLSAAADYSWFEAHVSWLLINM